MKGNTHFQQKSRKNIKIIHNKRILGIIIILAIIYSIFSSILNKEENKSEEYMSILTENSLERDSFPRIDHPHYSHLPITYRLKNMEVCSADQEKRVREALSLIQQSTNSAVFFEEVTKSEDIIIDCINLGEQVRQFSLNKTCEERKISIDSSSEEIQKWREENFEYKEELIASGIYVYPSSTKTSPDNKFLKIDICYLEKSRFEYDPVVIFDTMIKTGFDGVYFYKEKTNGVALPIIEENLILNASVEFYKSTPNCKNFPHTEVHELLHSLGFEHYEVYEGDIMNSYFIDCNQIDKIDEKYGNCLKYIYSNGNEGVCYNVNFISNS